MDQGTGLRNREMKVRILPRGQIARSVSGFRLLKDCIARSVISPSARRVQLRSIPSSWRIQARPSEGCCSCSTHDEGAAGRVDIVPIEPHKLDHADATRPPLPFTSDATDSRPALRTLVAGFDSQRRCRGNARSKAVLIRLTKTVRLRLPRPAPT